jgi:hypothetical protein
MMTTVMKNYLTKLSFGEPQAFKNMGVLPILAGNGHSPNYVTLKEALTQKLIKITEVNQSGSVPNLKVINESDQLVLLLDGEELVGAKQNRVLNTSVLLQGHSETVIPVSCTEQGRWRYASAEFEHSGLIMAHKTRALKSDSVHTSLSRGRGHTSDQSRVWASIDAMHTTTGTLSPTRAMKDVYQATSKQLDEYLQSFTCVPQQQGCLVFINSQVVGLDVLSDEAIYQQVHLQLLKSYAMEAILEQKEQTSSPSLDQANLFLQAAGQSQENQFDTVGLGYECRLDHPTLRGSALIYKDQVIHTALFKK